MERLQILLDNLPAIDGDWTAWKLQITELMAEQHSAREAAESERDSAIVEVEALQNQLNAAEDALASQTVELEEAKLALLSLSSPEPEPVVIVPEPEPEVILEPEVIPEPEPEPVMPVEEPVAVKRKPLLL